GPTKTEPPAIGTIRSTGPEAAEDGWTRFRGPNGSGVLKSATPPVKLSSDNLAWKSAVPQGLSSPVLKDHLVVLTGLVEDRLTLIALSRETGAELWRASAPDSPLEKVHSASSPASSTPLMFDDRIIVYFGSFGLLCYDFEGNELWRRAIPLPKSLYGMSTSPIGWQNQVFLVLDSDRNLPESELSESKLIALDPLNGDILWETPRPFYRSGWSTPVIWSNQETDELVILGNGKLHAYDPASGKGKWFVKGFSRETIAVPVIGKTHIYGSSSQLGGGGDVDKDPLPFWEALKPFDKNEDGRIDRSEMTGDFTFPFRPELPPGHPGFGMPLPTDPKKRQEKIDWIVTWVDKNKDGVWTKEEFITNLKNGRGKPLLAAIKPGGIGDITETHVSWSLNRGIPEIPSPIYDNSILYLIRKGGLLTSIDCKTGGTIYQVRVQEAPGQYAASPVIAGEMLYVVSSLGKVSVIRLGEQYELLHQFDLAETSESTPAIDHDTIYFRTGTHLWAFRRK
ncbi:MAG: PQQ-binding-like beta-propeller repeat protein, partial [Verrucomicrobiota bacterium]